MTTKALKEIIERVQRWPEARQEDATGVLREMEEEDAGGYRLTDEQVAEVERRRTNLNRRFQSLASVKARFTQSKALASSLTRRRRTISTKFTRGLPKIDPPPTASSIAS